MNKYSYNGIIITAESKEDAIHQIVADSKKPEIDMKVVNKWAKKDLSETDKRLGIDHWKDEKTGKVYYSLEAATRIAKGTGYHVPTAKDWSDLAKAFNCSTQGSERYGGDLYNVTVDYDGCEKLRTTMHFKCDTGRKNAVGLDGCYWVAARVSHGLYSMQMCRVFKSGGKLITDEYDSFTPLSVRLVKD